MKTVKKKKKLSEDHFNLWRACNGYLIRNDFKCKDKDKFERSKGTGKKSLTNLRKDWEIRIFKGFLYKYGTRTKLSQGKVRGLHTNIPLTQDKSKWVWHFDTLTPYSIHNRVKAKSIQLFRVLQKLDWLWRRLLNSTTMSVHTWVWTTWLHVKRLHVEGKYRRSGLGTEKSISKVWRYQKEQLPLRHKPWKWLSLHHKALFNLL